MSQVVAGVELTGEVLDAGIAALTLAGKEGTVGIRFTVDPTGRVLDAVITQSSGSLLLDDAASDMLAGQRVPGVSLGMTLALTTVPVNIRFELAQ